MCQKSTCITLFIIWGKIAGARETCPISCWWQNHSQGEGECGVFCMIISCSMGTLDLHSPLRPHGEALMGTGTVSLAPPLWDTDMPYGQAVRLSGKRVRFQLSIICFIFLYFSLSACKKGEKIWVLSVVEFDISKRFMKIPPLFPFAMQGRHCWFCLKLLVL